MTPSRDLYEILQVHHSAEPEVIEAAYRRLARMYHPDVNSDPAAAQYMKDINLAYELLRDSVKRAQYDRSRKGQSDSSSQKRRKPSSSGTPRPPREPRRQSTPTTSAQTPTGERWGWGTSWIVGLGILGMMIVGIVISTSDGEKNDSNIDTFGNLNFTPTSPIKPKGNDEAKVVAEAMVEATAQAAPTAPFTESPEGSRIAFHSTRDGNFEIYVMNADGSGQTNLTNHYAEDHTPSWSLE